jgi:hypothetical protein
MANPFNPEDITNQANERGPGSSDWRFRIRLASDANYLYKDTNVKQGESNILSPLAKTDGVIFPYTPQIMVNYQSNYSQTSPTHSNYKQYFYQGSEISDIQITGTFTAQSTNEADYLLAAIHFFRSASKMFYGQDDNRGTPPPLLFLEGLGEHQFNGQPCVLQQFNYVLPPDVDYVRTSSAEETEIDLSESRVARNGYRTPLTRLFELFQNGVSKGAEQIYYGNGNSLATRDSTYVPTKMEFMLTFHPIVSRKRQSKEFSVSNYSKGAGLRGGQW